MISSVQIAYIASLPPETDFRFERSYGETNVVVRGVKGTLRISEDGAQHYLSDLGQSSWFSKTETLRLEMDESDI